MDEAPSATGSPDARNTAPQPDLVFREVPHDTCLIFTSPERAIAVDRVYRALESPTWGEFRRKMDPDAYAGLVTVMLLAGSVGVSREPEDHEPLCCERVPGYSDGDWPPWLMLELEHHLSPAVLTQFATSEYSFVSGPFLRIDAKHRAAILKALADSGLTVEERADLTFW